MEKNRRILEAVLGATLALGSLPGCTRSGPDPEQQRRQTLGIQCEAQLAVKGSFQPGAPQPADVVDCWPDGTWTFSAATVQNDCPAAPALAAQYVVQVTHDADGNEIVTYAADPTSHANVKITTHGPTGGCQGAFEFYSADGRQLANFKPDLQSDGTLSGNGSFTVFKDPQL